jgi:SAM-dependent methyltransferase
VSTATSVERFWADHQVGGPYDTVEESEQALAARRALYPALELLMPTDHPGKTILDYGCGPGHDTVQFLQNGAEFVYYADASPLALLTTERRLQLHGVADRAMPVLVPDGKQPVLPPVEHVHCAGVLHHVTHPDRVLTALHLAALRHDAEIRLMVYDGGASPPTQSLVPVTRWWTREQVEHLAHNAGLVTEYVGGYSCEADWRKGCVASCYVLRPE